MYHLVFSLLACLSLPMSKSLSLFFSPSITLTQLSFSPSPLSPLKFLSCFSLSHPFSTNLLNSPVCICSAGPPLPPSHILSSSCIVNMERQCSVVFNIYSASIEGSTNQYINIRLYLKKTDFAKSVWSATWWMRESLIDGSFWWYFVNVKPLTCAFSSPTDWKTENNKALQDQMQTGLIFVRAKKTKQLLSQKQLQYKCIDISPPRA